MGFPGGTSGREPGCQRRRYKRLGFDPRVGRARRTHSSIFAWRIPRTEEPSRLQSIALQRVGHNWSDLACTNTCIIVRQWFSAGTGRVLFIRGHFWLFQAGFWGGRGELSSRIKTKDTARTSISTGQPQTTKNYHPSMSAVDILKNPGMEHIRPGFESGVPPVQLCKLG